MGVCHMCDGVFKDKVLKLADDYFFCPEHFEIYTNNSWLEIMRVEATNEIPEDALLIQEKKDELKAEGISSFIKTEYAELDGTIKSVFILFVSTENYNRSKGLIQKSHS